MNEKLTDFIMKVSEMRKQQKLYFSSRSKCALIRSKELEKEVDAMLFPLKIKAQIDFE